MNCVNTSNSSLQNEKKQTDFISSNFILHVLFVCYLGMVDFNKNARNICVAICPGFTQNIASLPGLQVLCYVCKLQCLIRAIVLHITYVSSVSMFSELIYSNMVQEESYATEGRQLPVMSRHSYLFSHG